MYISSRIGLVASVLDSVSQYHSPPLFSLSARTLKISSLDLSLLTPPLSSRDLGAFYRATVLIHAHLHLSLLSLIAFSPPPRLVPLSLSAEHLGQHARLRLATHIKHVWFNINFKTLFSLPPWTTTLPNSFTH